VQEKLCSDGFVLRYRPQESDDGLPGGEGVFLACSFWLADALAGIGRTDEATALFERLLKLRNDVGMLSEEYDTQQCRQVGNVPQAFSMVGLINTARHLSGSRTTTSAHRHEQDLSPASH
jgi:GH15 family glucan-1,4-alpha-glucosidase